MATLTIGRAGDSGQARAGRLEFWIVISMLGILAVLVFFILRAPTPIVGGEGEAALTGKDILTYRSDLLSTLLTAFGAWVAAGAAYFFGSKSMESTADAYKSGIGAERLKDVWLKDLTLDELKWEYTMNDPLSKVVGALEKEARLWWVPVLDEHGKLRTVLHEEAFYRFFKECTTEGKQIGGIAVPLDPEEFDQLKLKQLVEWVEQHREWRGVIWDIATTTKLNRSVASLNDEMVNNERHVAIVLNDKGEPVHALTDGAIKKALESC